MNRRTILLSWVVTGLIAVESVSAQNATDPPGIDGEYTTALREYELARSYMQVDNAEPPFLRSVSEMKGGNILTKQVADYSEAIRKYRDAKHKDDDKRTPQELFQSSIDRLNRLVTLDPSQRHCDSLRDVISDYIEAQTLVGNDALIEVFSSRFPSRRPSSLPARIRQVANGAEQDDDQGRFEEEVLAYAASEFRLAANVAYSLLNSPAVVRIGDVFGLVAAPNDLRKQRPSEFKLIAYTADRNTRTALSSAKHVFFESAYGKGKDEVRARSEAKELFRACAHESYLWAATLAAVSPDSPTLAKCGATEIRKTLGDAQQGVFDIANGLKPRALVKSYIPEKDAADVFDDAINAVTAAVKAEKDAEADDERYQASIASLRQELQSQRDRFASPLRELTGQNVANLRKVTDVDGNVREFRIDHEDPITAREQRRLLKAYLRERVDNALKRFTLMLIENKLLEPSEVNLGSPISALVGDWQDLTLTTKEPQSIGQIGQQLFNIREAQLAVLQQRKALNDFAERITLEREYVRKLRLVIEGKTQEIGLNLIGIQLANSVHVSVGFPGGASVSFQPLELALLSGFLQKRNAELQAQIQIEGAELDTEKRVRQLLLDQIQAYFETQKAAIRLAKEYSLLETQFAQLDWLIESWAENRGEAAQVYEKYPVYLMERNRSQRDAEASFDTALEKCYVAAKALEYQWTEEFRFTISVVPKDVDLPKEFASFQTTDSVLGARRPNDLRQFLRALKEWHDTLRKFRGGQGTKVQRDPPISIRKHILSLDDTTEGRLRFGKWIREHTVFDRKGKPVALLFQFSTARDYYDKESLLFNTNEWNQKIIAVGVSVDGVNLFAEASPGPSVQLAPGGISYVRVYPVKNMQSTTFDLAGLAPDDVTGIRRELEFGGPSSFSEYRNHMKVLGIANAPALLFQNLSGLNEKWQKRQDRIGVAASNWTCLIDISHETNNRSLRIDNIEDIRIGIEYEHGKDAAWVKLPAVPP